MRNAGGANLFKITAQNAVFDGVILLEATLSEADLFGASFVGVDLTRADNRLFLVFFYEENSNYLLKLYIYCNFLLVLTY